MNDRCINLLNLFILCHRIKFFSIPHIVSPLFFVYIFKVFFCHFIGVRIWPRLNNILLFEFWLAKKIRKSFLRFFSSDDGCIGKKIGCQIFIFLLERYIDISKSKVWFNFLFIIKSVIYWIIWIDCDVNRNCFELTANFYQRKKNSIYKCL